MDVERGFPSSAAAVLSAEALSKLIEAFAGSPPRPSLVAALLGRIATEPNALTEIVRSLIVGDARALSSLERFGAAQNGTHPDPFEGNLFRREGDYWTIAYRSHVVRLHDAKGLQYLAALLQRPGSRVRATDLAARADPSRARLAVTKAIKGVLARLRSAHPALGAHLSDCVRTGATCVYLSDAVRPTRWRT